jgi:hypothetical protein
MLMVLAAPVGLVGPPTGPAVAQTPAWLWPLPGPHEVSRPFAPPASRYGSGHRGADLAGEVGAVVVAAGPGRVSYAGLLAGRGVVVVVHGDLRTTYEPVTASVTVGTSVDTGAPIGRLEATHAGCPAAACLHWGLRRGEDYLDPVRLVDRGPARLLPLGDAAVPGGEAAATGPAVPVPVPSAARPEPGGSEPVGAESASEDRGTGPAPDGWALRAAQLPLDLAAVAVLVVGLALVVRRWPGPGHPAGGGSSAHAPDDSAGPDALVLQLDAERLRRRAG